MKHTTKIALLFTLLLFAALLVWGQWPYFSNPPRNLVATGMVLIPSTPADPYTATVWLDQIVLSNTHTAAVTVTLSDKSTNCAAGVCSFLKDVSIAAKTTYLVNIPGGLQFPGGATWGASVNAVIVGSLRGVQY